MSQITDDDLILVTGASGYLATHVIKQLLEAGYRVRGTVRSVKDEKKTGPLIKMAANTRHTLELVEADLTNPSSWPKAVEGCTYVIHTASPVPNYVPKDENEIIKPAVDGVLNVFKACVQDGNKVKRVIQTSSLSAIAGDHWVNGKTFSEADFSVTEGAQPYTKSKILSEKAAWDFVNERKNKGQPCFELVVLNPGFMTGPVLSDVFSASMELPKGIMCRELFLVPKMGLPPVDIRDVASVHIKSLTMDNVVGKRFLLVSTTDAVPLLTFAKWLSDEFSSKGYSIPLTPAPSFLLKISTIFDKRITFLLPYLEKFPKFDNSRYLTTFGIQPYDPKKSLVEMTYSMIEKGLIPKKF